MTKAEVNIEDSQLTRKLVTALYTESIHQQRGSPFWYLR